MTVAIAVVVLLVVAVVSYRLPWAAHELPFAVLFLVVGVVVGSGVLVVCGVAIAVIGVGLMVNRRKGGRPMRRAGA